MKEYAIGEEFTHNGVRLKCVKHDDDCEYCCFYNIDGCADIVNCNGYSRKDNIDVKFIRVPKMQDRKSSPIINTKHSNLLNALTPILLDEPPEEVQDAINVIKKYCEMKQGESE